MLAPQRIPQGRNRSACLWLVGEEHNHTRAVGRSFFASSNGDVVILELFAQETGQNKETGVILDNGTLVLQSRIQTNIQIFQGCSARLIP